MDNNTTYLCTTDETSITIRGKDLVTELVGHLTYTEMVFFLLRNRVPTPAETRALDACLVILMEHGLTLNTLTARFVASAVPDQIQVAMGASLMTIGDTFMGTMEGCARILQAGVKAGGDPRAYCAEVAAKHRAEKKAVPGFGHRFHKPDDPRSARLFEVAEQAGAAGPHIAMLRILAEEVDRAAGKHITINATGAIGAAFSDIGFGPEVMRGLAVVSRSGGLVAHIAEERQSGSARLIEKLAKQNVQYRDPPKV
ncbi:citryl-CoA lyase [Roseomonas terrae]|jgi:citrate synthase|uniref:citrate synthase (unknown stereospecificity) n=1 Tax=Neoroseomonas terrae TaxID=424799 RepID=A0ABS5EC48_9PROT|nr:citryl-CoA lyase [Neoroseomonas terrae]MBR0648267.1 citryl-CoA lyase [Neoroseomonas terrae]